MIDFSGRQRAISIGFEILRQTHAALPFVKRAKPRSQTVNARCRRAKAQHQTCPGRVAQRRLTMSVEKNCAAGGEVIKVRSLDQRVATQGTYPIILIIETYK